MLPRYPPYRSLRPLTNIRLAQWPIITSGGRHRDAVPPLYTIARPLLGSARFLLGFSLSALGHTMRPTPPLLASSHVAFTI